MSIVIETKVSELETKIEALENLLLLSISRIERLEQVLSKKLTSDKLSPDEKRKELLSNIKAKERIKDEE